MMNPLRIAVFAAAGLAVGTVTAYATVDQPVQQVHVAAVTVPPPTSSRSTTSSTSTTTPVKATTTTTTGVPSTIPTLLVKPAVAAPAATLPPAMRHVWVIAPNGQCVGVDAANIPDGSRQVPSCEQTDRGAGGDRGIGPDGQPVHATDPAVWVEYPGGGCGQTGAAEAEASGLTVVSACPNSAG